MTNTNDLEQYSNMDLANLIYETEGFAWRLNHDAGDGRIPEKGVDESVRNLHSTRDQAANILKQRTGITEHQELSEYVMGQVKEQDRIWEEKWKDLSEEGTVFRYKDGDTLFETIRSYLPAYGWSGPKSFILYRIQGTDKIGDVDNRRVTDRFKVPEEEASSMYKDCSPLEKGLIKFDEEVEKRQGEEASFTPRWHNLDPFDQTVFYHSGFDETFEVIGKYNLRNTEREYENELILAKSHDRPVFVEFRPEEVNLITVLHQKPKYKSGARYSLSL